ncbi:hypothetical protein TSUD_186900 [Trifolium subterraneum]|uniref:Uncharacterized protein n=1 Tax=Trifolium subterraneum TaxID=3900 RepID=A0A2Z6PQY2_TRISU|nr:hypothetical protein TSUD_186900 [Trifolium subterraneum]
MVVVVVGTPRCVDGGGGNNRNVVADCTIILGSKPGGADGESWLPDLGTMEVVVVDKVAKAMVAAAVTFGEVMLVLQLTKQHLGP